MTVPSPLLTLIASSRNDSYQGNSQWRLETALNFIGQERAASGVAVEIIVTDWGSDTPLRKSLSLSPEAARVTSFLEVPPDLARSLQGDSPFPEVLANNAAIQRASGEFIGRIDQDTLVTREFLGYLAEQSVSESDRPWESAVLFAGRRCVPRGFTANSPSISDVVSFINRFGWLLPPEGRGRRPWFDMPVGILLMHRRLWRELSGYDERLLYWGYMDAELVQRASAHFPLIDIGRSSVGRFFHLGHSPRLPGATRRRKNTRRPTRQRLDVDDWGLAHHELAMRHPEPAKPAGMTGEPTAPRADLLAQSFAIFKEWFWESALYVPRVAVNLYRYRSDGTARGWSTAKIPPCL